MNYQDLVDRWKSLPHKTRKNIRLAAVVVVLGTVSALVVHATRNNLKGSGPVKDDTSATVLLAPTANLSTQNLAATVENLTKQVAALRSNMAENNGMTEKQIASYLQAHPVQAPKPKAQVGTASSAQLAALEAQIQALQAKENAPAPVAIPQAPNAPGYTVTSPQTASAAPGIYEVQGNGVSRASGAQSAQASGALSGQPPQPPKAPQDVSQEPTGQSRGAAFGLPTRTSVAQQTEAAKHGQKPAAPQLVRVNDANQVYLPAGTILTAVSLNGVNVGTGPTAQSNPQIVEMRMKKPAILPNGYRVNLNNCLVINTGFGNLAAQRVYLRPTTLSCVDDQGHVIEAAIKGTVVGADGIAGISGVVVDHQGALIAKGFMAGLFSGLGGAFSPTSVTPLQINPGSTTQYQYPSGAQVMGSAVAGGVNNAGSMIAKLYIDEAKALQPTLQINPGITADIILESGAYVKKMGMTKAELQKTDYQASAAGATAPSQQQVAQQQAQATLAAQSQGAQQPTTGAAQ